MTEILLYTLVGLAALGLIFFFVLKATISHEFNKKIQFIQLQVLHLQAEIQALQSANAAQSAQGEVRTVSHETAVESQEVFLEKQSSSPKELYKSEESREELLSEEAQLASKAVEKNAVERWIGKNLLTLVGVLTLVLGIGYFIKYAIDQNWIGETFRILIAASIGLLLIGVAHRLKNAYRLFSSTLVAGGLSILYFSVTFAFREYELIGINTAFFTLFLISCASIGLALYYNRQELFICALLGGFSAPLLLSTGQANYFLLFSYLFLLNSAIVFVSSIKNWKWIGLMGFAISCAYQSAVLFEGPVVQELFKYSIFVFGGLFYLQYTALIFVEKQAKNSSKMLYVAAHVFALLYFTQITAALGMEHYGLTALVLGAINLLAYFISVKTKKVEASLSTVFLALAISFLALAIPLFFDGKTTTISWSLGALLLLVLWKKTQFRLFQMAYLALLPLAVVSLIIDWQDYATTVENPIVLNSIFMTSLTVTVSLFAALYLLRAPFKLVDPPFVKLALLRTLVTYFALLTAYFGALYEILYHTSASELYDWHNLAVLLYTTCFLAALSLVNQRLYLGKKMPYKLLIAGVCTAVVLALTSRIAYQIFWDLLPHYAYGLYLIYLFPLALFYSKTTSEDDFKSGPLHSVLQWFLYSTVVLFISVEGYNLFVILFSPEQLDPELKVQSYQLLSQRYSRLILPIIWGLLALGTLLLGLKKNLNKLPMMALALFVVLILKLYFYDVWQMDNVARIISFIVLGLLILISSFIYQKLKKAWVSLVVPPNKDGTDPSDDR